MAIGEILRDLNRDEEMLLLAKSVSEFADRELAPYVRQLGREEFPARFISLAGKNGFLGTAFPTEYGGQGGTLEGLLAVIEGIAACDGSLALTLAAHEGLAATHILLGGNEEQKRRYLPGLTSGSKLGAWCLTEPQAGSNIFNDCQTRLVRDGEGWKLSGEKTFITNGCYADLFVVLARTIGRNGNDTGMTACVVERSGNSDDRILAAPLHGKMGMTRSNTASLRFNEVAVSDDAILGSPGSGDRVARRLLFRGRIGVGALALGLARDSLERAAVYAQGRNVAGGPLYQQPLTRAKLLRMEENLWLAWQGVRSAAQCVDQSRPFKVQACMAKVFATETALRIADEAIQILGGYGYMGDYKVEQNYRDARLLTIGEGASEILRFAIARNLLDRDQAGRGDYLPSADALAALAEPFREDLGEHWDVCWRALQFSADSVHLVREHFEHNLEGTDADAPWQLQAVVLADVATRLWVTVQGFLTAARLINRGADVQKNITRLKSLLANSSLDICHHAAGYFQNLGLTDVRLHTNYIEARQIGAAVYAPPAAPLPVEHW